jgi:hypothetical protein
MSGLWTMWWLMQSHPLQVVFLVPFSFVSVFFSPSPTPFINDECKCRNAKTVNSFVCQFLGAEIHGRQFVWMELQYENSDIIKGRSAITWVKVRCNRASD